MDIWRISLRNNMALRECLGIFSKDHEDQHRFFKEYYFYGLRKNYWDFLNDIFKDNQPIITDFVPIIFGFVATEQSTWNFKK